MQKKEPHCEKGVLYWKCSKCEKWLTENYFYKDNRTPNKLKNQCKICHVKGTISTRNADNARKINREFMRRARKSNPDKYKVRDAQASKTRPKNEKTKARELLNHAVKSGKIIKPTNCSCCGKIRKVTGHHPDYSKPLEVIWLCYECHGNK